jgi:hypothetical protein
MSLSAWFKRVRCILETTNQSADHTKKMIHSTCLSFCYLMQIFLDVVLCWFLEHCFWFKRDDVFCKSKKSVDPINDDSFKHFHFHYSQ